MNKSQSTSKNNLALPDSNLTIEELKSVIEKSVNSTFHPIKELKKSISKWKLKSGK